MRFYNPGDEIYIFGFSRGAYIARFLAEMLDYVGLLSHGNEEMVVFAWKAFSNWQSRQGSKTPEGIKKKKEMYAFMKGFRETFSRPVRRIRFLGLFDTVNSVPRFETAWMERSRFPYTARTSAKVIRHAVAIDERRAKFRQDLIYQSDRGQKGKEKSGAQQGQKETNGEHFRKHAHLLPGHHADSKARGRRCAPDASDDAARYRARSHSAVSRKSRATAGSAIDSAHHDAKSEVSVAPHPHDEDQDVDSVADSEDETDQDIDEVWFAGGHADIGGGWEMLPESKAASHVPLVWMVHEAMKAGLHFDLDKVREMGCIEAVHELNKTSPNQQETTAGDEAPPNRGAAGVSVAPPPVPNIMVRSPSNGIGKLFQRSNSNNTSTSTSSSSSQSSRGPPTFREMMHQAHTALIHDSLKFNGGLPHTSVLAWKVMECVLLFYFISSTSCSHTPSSSTKGFQFKHYDASLRCSLSFSTTPPPFDPRPRTTLPSRLPLNPVSITMIGNGLLTFADTSPSAAWTSKKTAPGSPSAGPCPAARCATFPTTPASTAASYAACSSTRHTDLGISLWAAAAEASGRRRARWGLVSGFAWNGRGVLWGRFGLGRALWNVKGARRELWGMERIAGKMARKKRGRLLRGADVYGQLPRR